VDEDVEPRAGSEQAAAERRALERVAYGRGADDADRRVALAALAERRSIESASGSDTASRAEDGAAPGSARTTSRPGGEDGAAPGSARATSRPGGEGGEQDATPRDDDRGSPGRAARVLWGVAAAAAVAGMALGITTGEQRPAIEVFSRAQTVEERDIPGWLVRALLAAEEASGDAGTQEALTASVRIPLGAATGTAFAFRDAETICLAAAEAFNCVNPADFAATGIRIEVIDPSSSAGIYFQWGPLGGLRMERRQVAYAQLRNMDPAEWPRLMNRCMQLHRYGVSAASNGVIYPASRAVTTTLSFTIARVDCFSRFPLEGPYFSVEPQ
jgi:hypothetical protein